MPSSGSGLEPKRSLWARALRWSLAAALGLMGGCRNPPPIAHDDPDVVCPARAEGSAPRVLSEFWDPAAQRVAHGRDDLEWLVPCWGHAQAVLTRADNESRPCDEGIAEYWFEFLVARAPELWRGYDQCADHADELSAMLVNCVVRAHHRQSSFFGSGRQFEDWSRGRCEGLAPQTQPRTGCWDEDLINGLNAAVRQDAAPEVQHSEAQLRALEPALARTWAELRPQCAPHAAELASLAISQVLDPRGRPERMHAHFSSVRDRTLPIASNADWWFTERFELVKRTASISDRGRSKHTAASDEDNFWICWRKSESVSRWACRGKCKPHRSRFGQVLQETRMREAWSRSGESCRFFLDELTEAAMMCVYESPHWCPTQK